MLSKSPWHQNDLLIASLEACGITARGWRAPQTRRDIIQEEVTACAVSSEFVHCLLSGGIDNGQLLFQAYKQDVFTAGSCEE